MQSDYETYLGKIDAEKDSAPRLVQSLDGTTRENGYARPEGAEFDVDVDHLFGASPAYVRIKRENPTHRLILWMRLNGHKPKEIATTLRITPQTVYNVQGQPWFQEAFIRISTEQGKDAVQTFLEGAVLPAVIRIEELAKTSMLDTVKLAADKELLDRFFGKPVVKTENKNETRVENVIFDVEKLKAEKVKLEIQLRSRIGGGTN